MTAAERSELQALRESQERSNARLEAKIDTLDAKIERAFDRVQASQHEINRDLEERLRAAEISLGTSSGESGYRRFMWPIIISVGCNAISWMLFYISRL